MSNRGNFISEWFGHRIYPKVSHDSEARFDQENRRCPILSRVTNEERPCVKAPSSLGVCTISSMSNQVRQDWLTCPYRALQDTLLSDVASSFFGDRSADRLIIPAPALADKDLQSEVLRRLTAGREVTVYLQDKLGGEISVSKTDRSPEMSFDITLAQLQQHNGGNLDVASYGILEIQTMDFHGSYRAAVKNLQDALRLHGNTFSAALEQNPQWAGERIEGPNIANVFKRTFYQMMLKFRVGEQQGCRGCTLALPESVWDSWQRHLGRPDLAAREGGDFELSAPTRKISARPPAWIYVFGLDEEADVTPNPITIKKRIATDADAIAHFALSVAPEAAVGGVNLISERIRLRLARFWPNVWPDAGVRT